MRAVFIRLQRFSFTFFLYVTRKLSCPGKPHSENCYIHYYEYETCNLLMLSILQYHRFVLFFFGNSVFLSCGLMECAERWISLHMIYKSLSCSIFEYQILEVHKTINFETSMKKFIKFRIIFILLYHAKVLIK